MSSPIFRQARNDDKNLEAIADGYKTKIDHEHWLVDGLQKDAIQNSWDARIDKKRGLGWECGFGLLNINNEKVLCIKDSGTTGLNGTKFYSELEMGKILIRNEKGEDLAYFLNSDWSAKSIEEGGNRGRGKFLFLYASRNKRIFFDSFRSTDKEYLFGDVYLDSDKQIKFKIYYGEEAKNVFKNFIDGKQTLLSSPGTRIFITNPNPLIEQSIQTGELFSYISYSRWEILKKYHAKIFVYDGKEKKYISLPVWYEDKEEDENNKKYELEIIKSGTDYKIKRLVLRYSPNLDLPETIRGIAIQRGGMTIERVKADELVHEEGMTDIYGWLEMEEKKSLENEMKNNCEGPEHFNFSWTQKPAKYLRDYLRNRIRDFAKELKIVSSEQAKRNKTQRSAEMEALKSLLPLFKKLELFGKHKGRTRKKGKRKENEPLRLSSPDIIFPRDNRRINYGEIIKNAYVVPINDLDKSLMVLIKVFLLSKEGKEILIEEKEINLSKNTKINIGNPSLMITKDFKQGSYTFKAKMISLEDTDLVLSDGTKIEQSTKIYERINLKFYIETEPDESGKFPFDFQPKPSENKQLLFDWESDGDNGYIVYYNSIHPKIKPLLLEENPDILKKYLIEQGALIAYQIKLEELVADNNNYDKDFNSLIKAKDLTKVLPFLIKKFSEFIWDLNN